MSSFLVVRRFAVSGVRSNSRSMCTIASGSLGGKWKDKEAAQENMVSASVIRVQTISVYGFCSHWILFLRFPCSLCLRACVRR